MVIWECQLKPDTIEATMEAAARLLDQAREEWEGARPKSKKTTTIARPYEIDDEGSYAYAAEDEEP